MKKECCECLYFKPYRPSNNLGKCHRYPPVKLNGVVDRCGDFKFIHPAVEMDDWCGEFRQKRG
jgi:hypothetical protein